MSKEKNYSYIMQWIKKYDIDLFECICDLCLESAFIPHKKSNGITFILPDKNSEIRKNILEHAYQESENMNTAEAIKLLDSLIINDYFPDIPTFEKYKMNNIIIINRLKIKMDIKKVKNNNIVFKNNLIIEPMNKFNENVKKDEETNKYNIAVWKMIEGNSYLDGTKISEQQLINKTKSSHNYRQLFSNFIENNFIQNIINNNIYLFSVFKILTFLQLKHKKEYIKIKFIIDPDPIITFYLLIEPYKNDSNYLISDEILSENLINNILKSDNLCINLVKKEYKKMVLENDNTIIIENIDEIRDRISNDIGRNISLYSIESYKSLEIKNTINKMESVLPESLFNHYNKNNNKRLWQDEFRFIIGEDIKNMHLETFIKTKISHFMKICNKIKMYYTGNNYSEELTINNENDISKILPNCFKDRINIIICFVKSCDFLFTVKNHEHYHNNRLCRHTYALNNLNSEINEDDIDFSFSYQLKKYIDNGKTYEDLVNTIS